ncbi:MAG: hypothetical protein ACR2M1_15785 [Gemmatimonadaceae bacterium]
MDDYVGALAAVIGGVVFPIGLFLLTADAHELLKGYVSSAKTWDYVGVATIIVGVGFLVWATKSTSAHASNVRTLEEENRDLRSAVASLEGEVVARESNLFEFTQDRLKDIAHDLRFGRDMQTERITIYSHDPNGFFTAFGRYSKNPKHIKKSQKQYGQYSGCIGEAWKHGWYFADNYPDPLTDPKEWIDRCVRDGIEAETAEKIGLRARMYCAKRIDDAQDDPLAVVVIESTDPHRYTEKELRDMFGVHLHNLQILLSRHRAILPQVSYARQQGF